MSGRLVSLPAPPARSGRRWLVPVEFISRALALIYDARLDLRKPSRLLIVGDLRVPRITRPLRSARRLGASDDRRDAARARQRDAGGRPPHDQVRRRRARRRRTRRCRSRARRACCRPCAWSMRRRSPSISVRASRASGRRASRSTRRRGWSSICSLTAAADRRRRRRHAARRTAAPPPPPRRRSCRRPSGSPPSAIHTIAIDPGHGGEDAGVKGAERREGKGSDAGDRAPREGRDRSAARAPRAADARRRPQRADRRAHGDREQQQGRPVHQPARQRVAAQGDQRRVDLLRRVRARRRAATRPPAAPTACRPSAAARATSSSCSWDLAQTRHLDQSAAFAGMLEQQLRDRVPLAAQADRPRRAARARVGEHAGGPDRDGLPDEPGSGEAARRPTRSRTRSSRRSTTPSSGSATRSSAGGTR